MSTSTPAPAPLAYRLDQLPFGRTFAYEEIKAKRLGAFKLGRLTFVLATELQRYLENRPAATPETMCDLAANRRKRRAAA